MPVLAMSAGRVSAIWGSAFVRLPDGTLKPLHVGDKVTGGEHIITEENGLVQISRTVPHTGHADLPKAVEANSAVDKAIAGVDAHEADQAPAAGLTGGAEGGLLPGLRVDRVVELASGSGSPFEFDASSRTGDALTGATANQQSQVANEPGTAGPAESLASVSINDVVVNEGAGTATFTVTLDKASGSVVQVSFATGDASDTATAGLDYTRTVGSISFEPGQTSKSITVPILNDNTYEGSEHFAVKLSDVSNAVIAQGLGTGTGVILDDGHGSVPVGITPDDDRPHVVAVSSPSAPEGGELDFVLKLNPASAFGADPHDQHYSLYDTPLTLTLSGVGDHPASVNHLVQSIHYSLDGGFSFLDASLDAQGHVYTSFGSPLTLGAGSPTTPIIVQVLTTLNDVHDGPQLIELTAASPFDTTPAQGVGTIDDRPYLLVQSGEPAVEGHSVVFDVVLTYAIDHAVTVKLDLQSGVDDPNTPQNESATVGVDTGTQLQYLDASGQWHDVVDGAVTIDAGQTLMQVRVDTVDDNIPEGTEYIKLHAHVEDAGLTANTDHANQTAIIDNDQPYLLVQDGVPAVEGQPIVFDVVLTHPLDQAVTIKLDLQSGVDDPDTPENESATVGVDTSTQLEYLDASGQWHDVVDGAVTMAAGQTLVQVRVATIDDGIVEDTEYIKLHAAIVEQGLTANTEHANQTAIIDNDLPYMLVQSGVPAVEGNPIVFDVVLTQAAHADVTVILSLASGIDDDRTPEHESATLGLDTGTQLQYLDAAGHWAALPDDGHVTFARGETLIQVRVDTYTDNLAEDTEYIRLNAAVVEDGLTANKSQFNQTAIIDKDSIPGVLEPIHLQVSGNDHVLDGNLSAHGAIGQPGGQFEHVASITVDGVAHDYDASQTALDLTTSHGGHLTVDMQTGQYSYEAPVAPIVGHESDVIDFSLLNQQHQVVASTMDIRLDQGGASTADALDLRDLLQGENTVGGSGNLDHYLAFNTTGPDTVITISPNGNLVDGHALPGTPTQDMTLPGVNLSTALGLDASANNVQIIAALLDQGKLLVDHG